MGLFSQKKAVAASTELPITTSGSASAAAATAASSTAVSVAPAASSAGDLGAAVGARSAHSTPAPVTSAPVPAKASRWGSGPHRAASDPVPQPTQQSALAATASGDHDAAFEAKFAHLTPQERKKLRELETLATTLDSKFGVGPIKFGYESIIGLVPFAGDIFGAGVGTYVIGNALHLGMPRRLVARMAINVGLDTAVGTIPFIGDIFDIAHKSNSKNIALLKAHLEHPKKATAADTACLCGAFCCVVVVPCLLFFGFLAGIIILILWLCRAIFQ
jgi:hypothetical protein